MLKLFTIDTQSIPLDLAIIFGSVFLVFVIVGSIFGAIDKIMRNTGRLSNFVIPKMWVMEIGTLSIIASLLIFFFFAKKYHLADIIATTVGIFGLGMIGIIVFRDGFEGRFIVNAATVNNTTPAGRYIYRLNKDKLGRYSLHVSKPRFYSLRRNISTASPTKNGKAVFTAAISTLKPGDSLVVVTGNKKLSKIVQARVPLFLNTSYPAATCSEYKGLLPPFIGFCIRLRHRWGPATLTRQEETGFIITL